MVVDIRADTENMKDVAEKAYQRALRDYNRTVEMLDYLPSTRHLKRAYPSEAYGDAHLTFWVASLEEVAEAMQDYTPVPAVLVRDNDGCTILCSEAYQPKLNKRDRERAYRHIAPFWVTLDRIIGSSLQVKVVWFSVLPNGWLVRCTAQVFSFVPEYSHQGGSPDWASITYKTKFSYGQRYITDVKASLKIGQANRQYIRWASGSHEQPNRFTFYWTEPSMTIQDIMKEDNHA